MIVNCFQIRDDRQLTPCDYESAVTACRDPDTLVWMDIQGFGKAELEDKLDRLEVHGLARRLCLEARDHPGFFPMSKLVFLVVPVLATAEDFHRMEHIAFLSRKNLLLTLRDTRAAGLQNTITRQDSADWLPDRSVAGLVAALMIVFALESLQRTAELKNLIMTIEDRMDREPDSVTMREVSQKRAKLLTLELVVSGQEPIVKALLASGRAPLKQESVREYLTCALGNIQGTDRLLKWLEGRIDAMRSIVDARVQERTNRRLGRLTVISVIFLPMTFLAGIWGMNFGNMPGLTHPLGYPIALGAILLIGASLYFYFRMRGWFD
jgi:magnesium transporter